MKESSVVKYAVASQALQVSPSTNRFTRNFSELNGRATVPVIAILTLN